MARIHLLGRIRHSNALLVRSTADNAEGDDRGCTLYFNLQGAS